MSDLASVRAEIKTWERDFASRHGRDPSVQDIRDQPHIAEKYKLYKKLSKAPPPPSTPPRSHSRLPVPKSRPADSLPSLPGFNPFSPTKKSAPILRPSTSQASRSLPNPFATPAKNKPSHRRAATPSPDPSPPVLPPNASSSHPVSTTAVSRARKRLRGEPVSPSPNKPKRQRIRSQAPPPIPKSEQGSSSSDHEPDQELPQCDFALADSPVKAPAGGKSFKLLFDDALPALPIAKKLVGSSATRPDSAPDPGFLQRTSANLFVPHSLKLLDIKSDGLPSARKHRVNRTEANVSGDHSLSHKPTFKTVVSDVSQPRTSVKRALDSGDLVPEHTEFPIPFQSQYPLIPPSPPPHDSINRDTGKGKAKATASRKKLRIEDEESDEELDTPDDIPLKIATIRLDRGKHSHRHVDDLDWDPLLHLGTPNHDPAVNDQIDHVSCTFSVDLPDKFHSVVAISPSRSQSGMEERVVRELLYGDRVGHYEPSRGGSIWDAGETDEGAHRDADTEDDWEGEPVPWEVGEL